MRRLEAQVVPAPKLQRPRTTDHIRVGIIGAGENTRLHHIPRLQSIEGVAVVAIANRTAESAQAVCNRFDIPKVRSHRATPCLCVCARARACGPAHVRPCVRVRVHAPMCVCAVAVVSTPRAHPGQRHKYLN